MRFIKFLGFYILNSIVNKLPFHYIRYICYKYIFQVKIDISASILRNVKLLYPKNITIGHNSIINWSVLIDGRGSKVIIGNNVWIGEGAAILSGVKIGEGSIIGTNSVVLKDIPPNSIAVGSPAKVIKKYDFDKKEWIKI